MNDTPSGFELVYDPDPALWLVGPTENRPPEVWIPGATQVLSADFGVDDAETREFIRRVLERFAMDDSSTLTERLLRWRNISDDPFPVYLGMVEREYWQPDDIEAFLQSVEEDLVEPAIVTEVEASNGVRIRRAIGYSSHSEGVVAGLRYVIDSGSDEVFAVMHTATRVPGNLIEALDDFDDLARTVRAVGVPA